MSNLFKLGLKTLALPVMLAASSFSFATPSGSSCTWQYTSGGGGATGFISYYTAVGPCVHSMRTIEGGFVGPGGSWITWITYS
ncbi:MAG: hypothetical protein COA42_14660 [Alteromonadaceae bacterium]|nr:MAG: hypothetical protein COA42_14660 [Alteromonadaceae bacterium]